MAVQALQRHAGSVQRQAQQLHGLTGLDGRAEFHVHGAGVHRLVGVRIDARGDPDQDLLPHAPFGGHGREGGQLLGVVHHKAADMMLQGPADIRVGLAVSLEPDVLRREARGEGGVHLPHGNRVQPHALLRHDPADRLEGGGLPGVKHPGPGGEALVKGPQIHAAVVADALGVHQVQGRAVLRRQPGYGLSGKTQGAVFIAGDVGCQHESAHLLGR